jgi:serine/threonine protein kinase
MSRPSVPPESGMRLPFPEAPAPSADAAHAGGDRSLRIGDLLEGRYQIESQLGEGGVGVVYRALQLKLNRYVAVKLLLHDTIGEEASRPRFQQEAMTLAALSHPHIVNLQDFGMVRGRPFLVMELLIGRTLRQLLDEEGALTPVRTLTLLRQLVLALAYAHERGVVHRDLKPANLIVQALPAYEHVTVLDFGMVKLLPGSQLARGEHLTRVGFTFGTPAYMSPEHALGGDVDGRSDLYAVGVLLFELLTGEKPFDGEVQDVLRHHLTSEVPKLAARRPALSEFPELQTLVERAMAKEPAERFANAAELLAAIDELLMSGLLADVVSDEEVELDGARTSLGPKMRETLEAAADALSSYARSSREVWRDRASPQLMRARRELQAAALRLSPKLRSVSYAAWEQLRPRVLRAAERITRIALEARSRALARALRARALGMDDRVQRIAPPLALPPPRPEAPPDEPAP